ncbi:MAG TPA: SMC family ATPase, partial [Candidatus Limnocylindrales bacterium]|nr:SMC family ATPase [Candidatus Limnocylindrales bacterium]
MLPVRLELKNFLAYRDPVTVLFEGLQLACLTGPNGAGKSSLLDGITWALWGEARGVVRVDELIHHGQEEMQVQLDFTHEGKLYRVLRKRSRKGRGSSTLDFFAHNGDDGWTSNAEPTITATQRRIDDLLRLNFKTFTHSAFLQQGKADSFTNLGPAERKNALAEMLGVERFKAYETAAKDKAQTIQRELDVLRGKLEQIAADLEREPALITQHRLAEEQYASASAALAEADARQQELDYVKPELDATNRAAADIQRRLENARRSLQDAMRRLAEAEAEVKRREEALAQRDQVEAGYHELLQARTENQALSEKFQHYVQLREQIRDRDAEVAKLRAAIEAQSGTLQARIAAASKIIHEADPDAFSRANEDVKRLDDAEAALTTSRDDIHRLEQERSALQAGTRV